MKIKVSLLTLMILLMLSGCAYFNTYYNAQEKFNLAEEEYSNLENSKNFPRGLTQNYEAVTVKSFKVIENFPESKWVDNAMYLFGISNYRLENYRVARKMFRRLTMEYPQSGYYQEAKLWIARCTYMNNEKKLAFEMLESFTENKANDMFFGDAMLLYAQLAIEENDLEKADMAYLRAISLIKNKNRKADFHYEYAIYLINVERLDEALTHLESIEKLSLNRDLLAKVQLQYAKIFRLQKDYSGSEELLKNMLANEKYIDIYSDLQLELAQIYRSMNDYSRAIERNKTIIVDYPNTPNAAVAAYRIAEMYLYDLGDMDKAGEYYKNTTKQDKNSFESSEAKKVIRIINQFATQQKTIKILEKNTPQLTEEPLKYYLAMKDSAAVDSLSAVNLKAYIPVAENYIKELITRGESLSFTFFLYDSSLSIYESIAENFPFSSSLARVLYIRAWVN
ncbi:MAG: tetratricopeptide repeat protein, partial [Candidatus Marinimicrobia bacterium]|nr:tetratricopeptide repeat protein [Candidatus Neomarinimicrobiota bacterium]